MSETTQANGSGSRNGGGPQRIEVSMQTIIALVVGLLGGGGVSVATSGGAADAVHSLRAEIVPRLESIGSRLDRLEERVREAEVRVSPIIRAELDAHARRLAELEKKEGR